MVTAFSARLAMNKTRSGAPSWRTTRTAGSVTIVREPRGWFESSRRYSDRYEDVEPRGQDVAALDPERRSMPRNGTATASFVLSFEQLVRETEPRCGACAPTLGLDFSDELLTPTFNGRPIRADSSRKVESYGVVRDRSEPPPLDAETLATIHAGTAELYTRALGRADA